MKLKNIFISLLVVTGFLSSCNSEYPVGPQDNEEVGLSLVLFVNDSGVEATTKADGGIAPTSDEQKIGYCHIAVFDDETGSATKGQLITSFDFSGDKMPLFDEATKRYTFSGLNIRTFGKASRQVKVLVIANVDGSVNASTITGSTSYEDYRKLVVTTSAFASDNLVKVGEISTALNAATIEVPLTQLTAKVNWGGIEGFGGGGSSAAKYEWKESKLDEKLKKIMDNNRNKLNASDLGNGEIGDNASWDDYYFKFNKDWGYYRSRLHMVKVTRTVTTGTSGAFTVTKVSVEGENLKSLLLIGSEGNTEYQVATDASELTGTDKCFYTYEKGLDNLKLNVDCAKSKTEVSYCYGIFRQEYAWLYDDWFPKRENIKVDDIYTFVGNDFKPITDAGVVWTLDTESSATETQSYTIDLSSIGIQHGYSYTVKGTYEPEVGANIKWKVVDMTGETITIPNFE